MNKGKGLNSPLFYYLIFLLEVSEIHVMTNRNSIILFNHCKFISEHHNHYPIKPIGI